MRPIGRWSIRARPVAYRGAVVEQQPLLLPDRCQARRSKSIARVALPPHARAGARAAAHGSGCWRSTRRSIRPAPPSIRRCSPEICRDVVAENRRRNRAASDRCSSCSTRSTGRSSSIAGEPVGAARSSCPRWRRTRSCSTRSRNRSPPTGLRVGWSAARAAVTQRMSDLLGHVGAWAPKRRADRDRGAARRCRGLRRLPARDASASCASGSELALSRASRAMRARAAGRGGPARRHALSLGRLDLLRACRRGSRARDQRGHPPLPARRGRDRRSCPSRRSAWIVRTGGSGSRSEVRRSGAIEDGMARLRGLLLPAGDP